MAGETVFVSTVSELKMRMTKMIRSQMSPPSYPIVSQMSTTFKINSFIIKLRMATGLE